MGEILVANGAGTSLPLLIQILPVAISGMFTLGAAIYVALRNSRAEHRRWLRQERLKTYSTFLEIASGGLEAIAEMDEAVTERTGGSLKAIQHPAEQTSDELQRPIGAIALLGPKDVTESAGAVRLALGWKALAIVELLGELDLEASYAEVPETKQIASLILTHEQVSRWAEQAFETLNHFQQVAAEEIQGHRTDLMRSVRY